MTAQREHLKRQIETVLAMNGDLMTLEDMIDLARAGRVQVFGNDTAVVASEIMAFPRGKICNAFLAAGTVAGVLQLEPAVEAFARQEGAASIITHGRPGWGRVGRKTGWTLNSWCFIKRLGKTNGSGP
jgi:hypothetical protein